MTFYGGFEQKMTHCKLAIALILVWYFLAFSDQRVGIRTVGPFATKEQCDWGREWTKTLSPIVNFSICWEVR